MLTVKEVAEIFKVSKQTIFNWIRKGYIKAIVIDSTYRIKQSEVERLKNGE